MHTFVKIRGQLEAVRTRTAQTTCCAFDPVSPPPFNSPLLNKDIPPNKDNSIKQIVFPISYIR